MEIAAQSPVVLLAAMPEELEPVKRKLQDLVPLDWPGLAEGYAGHYDGTPIVVLRSGIGLVNAAHTATLACVLIKESPRALISIGTAGAIPPHAAIGDLVVSATATAGDVNLTPFGYERGQVPGQPATNHGDETLLRLAQEAGAVPKDFACVDSFVGEEEASRLRELFPHVAVVEMESAAIAQVARAHGVPFVSLRSITDLCAAEQHTAEVDRSAASSADAALQVAARL